MRSTFYSLSKGHVMQRNFEFRISKKYDIVLCVLVLCTQMNMMFVMLLSVHPHRASCHILEYIDIEGTRLSSEISPTRTDWTS
jgi:hypothetical protein